MQDYATTPEIHTTEAGAEFFLYKLELKDLNTGETKPVTFVVIHRVWKDDPVMAAGMLLFEAAYQGELPWEAFVAAHYYAMQRPARPRSGIAPHLSKKTLIHNLKRKAARQELRDENGQPALPTRPKKSRVLSFIRSEVSRYAKSIDIDQALTYAEVSSGEVRTSIQRVPGFNKWADEFSQTFEKENEEDILALWVEGDGSIVWKFSQAFSDKLITRAQLVGVDLAYTTGSRMLYRSLEAVFQSVLDEIEVQYPELWATMGEESKCLHDLFYRLQSGAVLLYPAFDESDNGLMFRVMDTVRLSTVQLSLPKIEELLDVAAFTPAQLPDAIRQIAATGSFARSQMDTDHRKTSDVFDDKKPGAVDEKKKVYSLDKHIEHLVAPTHCHDLTYEDVITYVADKGLLSQQEAEIMIERRVNDVPIAELAKKYGYNDPSGITKVVTRAEAKILKVVDSDATLRAWRDERR